MLPSWSHPITRRTLLAAGLGGLSLPSFLSLQTAVAAQAQPLGKAKKCIIVFCWGGMSHLESWDLKPDSPAEIRGEFQPIATATPGVQISEHLPRLAKQTG